MTDELPPGWAIASLGSLGRWLGGGTPSKAVREYWENGTVHWVSPKDMKRPLIDSAQDQITEKAVEESATNLVPANSVLMVTRSGILEHSFPVAVNTVPVTMNQDLKAVAVQGVDAIYTSYFLQSRAQDILRACKKDGTTVASIDTDRLAAYRVAIAPAAEQQRIVSKIDELFSRIDEGERALERVQKLVERYRQSVLKAAVTGELTRDWREKNKDQLESGEALLARILKARREAWEKAELDKMKAKGITPANDKWKQKYEEPVAPDVVGLPTLPTGWVYVNIDVLVAPISASIRRGPFGSTLTKSIFVSSGYKVYEQQHAIGGDFTAGRYYIDEQKYQELSSFWLKPGDLIISCSGTVGRIATVPDDAEPGVMNQALLKLTLAPTVMNGEFFKLAFLHRLASFSSRGSGMNNFSGIEELKKMPFPLPPLDEQIEVLQQADRQFSVTGHQEFELQRQQRMVSSLRQAVLREGFRGALVSQEPTDEPASTLLERVAAERTNAPATPKRGRKPKTSEPA